MKKKEEKKKKKEGKNDQWGRLSNNTNNVDAILLTDFGMLGA